MLCQLAVELATANRVQSAAGAGCTQLPTGVHINYRFVRDIIPHLAIPPTTDDSGPEYEWILEVTITILVKGLLLPT